MESIIRYLLNGKLGHSTDGLFTIHGSEFVTDSKFHKAYNLGKLTESWGNREILYRAKVACWATAQVKNLDGDFVECGVNRGGLSRLIIEYVDFHLLDKKYYLLDTFQGLSQKYLSKSELEQYNKGKYNNYHESYDFVKNLFKEFNVMIIKGPVPDTLRKVNVRNVAFVSIDMNCVFPEIEAFKYFWPKLVVGGVMLLDDYNYKGHEEQRLAFDELSNKLKFNILPLPTGQGLIIKN